MPRTRKAKQVRTGQPMLIVLCGPSHAGKSTFARSFCRGFRIVSSERIRREQAGSLACPEHEAKVWQTFEAQIRKALKEGHDVVLDACHMSTRARWHALQGPNTHHRKICIVLDLPLESIRQRCRRDRRLSLKEVERMWRAFQDCKPTWRELLQEGFDEVCFIRG